MIISVNRRKQKDQENKDPCLIMLEEIDEVKGVKWTISMNSLIGPTVPDSMIPDDMKEMLQSDDCELAL